MKRDVKSTTYYTSLMVKRDVKSTHIINLKQNETQSATEDVPLVGFMYLVFATATTTTYYTTLLLYIIPH